MNLPNAQKLMNKINEAIGAPPKFIIEPQPLKHLGDKEKTIGFPPINPAPIGETEITKKCITNIWHNQMKESNWFQSQMDKAIKQKKKTGSGYKNKLMKANNEVVTKEYHIYASHPSEFKDCKACRVILNFFKWQKKSISPPKDSYASPKWTTFSGQPTTLLIDDPLIGSPLPEHKQLLPWKPQHANTCTCKKCEKLGTGSYAKKDKPTFVTIKGSPSFSHYENQIFGIDAVGFDTEMGKAYSGSICTTKSSLGCTEQLCMCGEVIIKWQ